jgi:Type IV secretion system pilin
MSKLWTKLLIPYAYAQSIPLTNPLCPGGSQSCANSSWTTVMTAVLSFLFWDVATPLCVIMVLVGAFQMMSAGGDPEKFSNGRKTLMYAAIGFVVALLAGGLTSLLTGIVNGTTH